MTRSRYAPRRARLFLLLAVVAGFTVGLLASGAHASPSASSYKYGRAWTKKRIKYFNKAKMWNWSVKKGVRAWNQSGIQPRFVRVWSKTKADVIIKVKELPSDVAGRATVGMPYRGKAKVWLQPKYMMSKVNGKFDMAHTVTHELGHVLGLDHDNQRCSVMNGSERLGTCKPPEPGMWRCRLIEAADIERALHLYAGTAASLRSPEECYKWRIPPPPTEVTATNSGDEVELAWRNPSSKGFSEVEVNRSFGTCPSGPDDPEATFVYSGGVDWADEVTPGGTTTWTDFLSGPSGSYCYAVWVAEEAGRFNQKAGTAFVEYTDPYGSDPEPDPGDPPVYLTVEDPSPGQ